MADIETRESELRAFEVDGERLRRLLAELGATMVGHYEFKRAVLDVVPADPDKWIRVRTNGTTTALAVKQRISADFDGTGEEEVQTADFDETLHVLKAMGGYMPRSIQESKRDAYLLDGVEVSIDAWPMLQEFIELEAPSEEAVYAVAGKLDIPQEQLTSESVESYYLRTLGIDVKIASNLTFDHD